MSSSRNQGPQAARLGFWKGGPKALSFLPLLAVFLALSLTVDAQTPCTSDANCGANVCINNACKPKPLTGGTCQFNSNCFNAPTEVCVNSKCSAKSAAGGPCDETGDCSDGTAVCETSKCRLPANGACTLNDQCQNPLACISSVCATKSAAGGTCDEAADCATAGSTCESNTCRLPNAATCSANSQCSDSAACINSKCAAKSAIGGPCDEVADCAIRGALCQSSACVLPSGSTCTANFQCATPTVCITGQCRAKSATGGACDEAADCATAGSTCEGSKCRLPASSACTINDDCSSPLACISSVCSTKSAAGGTCDEAADCSIAGSTCEGNICLSPVGTTCAVNADCSSGLACISLKCSAKSPTEGPCDEVADCTTAGSLCEGSKCLLPGGATCSANSQCGSGNVCINAQCSAKSPTGNPCDETADCSPAGSVCQGNKCLLSSGVTCAANVECASPLACISTKCSAKSATGGTCDEDSDCDKAGSLCQGNVCLLPAGATCSANAQCSSSLVCVGSKCSNTSPTGGKCDETADCAGTGSTCQSFVCLLNSGQVCSANNQCASPLVCVNNACASKSTNQGPCDEVADCDFAPSVCQGNTCLLPVTEKCTSNAQCSSPYACINNQCIAKSETGGTCDESTDCKTSGSLCESNRCVLSSGSACTSNIQCGSTLVCVNNVCASKSNIFGDCDEINDCITPGAVCQNTKCLLSYGQTCSVNNECIAPFACINSKCSFKSDTGEPCDEVADCDNAAASTCESSTCLISSGQTCAANAECVSGFVCIDSQCVTKSNTGGICDEGGDCSVTGAVCENAKCLLPQAATCAANADCSYPYVCINSKCAIKSGTSGACDEVSDCAIAGSSCQGNVCLLPAPASCRNNAECATPNACINNQCLAKSTTGGTCDEAVDCANGAAVCENSKCLLPITSGCTANAQCASPNVCISSACAAKAATGATCDEAADCSTAGSSCEASKCVLPAESACSTNAQCASGLVCVSSKCTYKSNTEGVCDEVADCAVSGSLCQGSKCLLPTTASCTYNAQCSTGLVCIANKCAAKSATGSPCDEASDCTTSGAICENLTCLLPSGATCSANAQCDPSLVCVSSKCAIKSGAGGVCDEAADCVIAGSTCQGSTCLLPVGSTCSTNSQCNSGLACINAQCSAKSPTGGSCDEVSDCSTSGSVCENLTCLLPVTSTCTANSQCSSGLVCVSGKCSAKSPSGGVCDEASDCSVTSSACQGSVCLLPIGAACSINANCASPLACINNKCSSKSVSGGPCDEVSDCDRSGSVCESLKCLIPAGLSCSSNSQCSSPLACITSQCSSKSATGGICDETGDCDVAGSSCQSGKCLLPSGATCSANTQCASPLACVNSKCASKSPNGGACDEVADCATSGSVCDGGKCLIPSSSTCSANSQCASPLVCISSKCASKSLTGGACDEAADCDGAGSLCQGSKCVLPSSSTCSANSQCSSGLVCVNAQCSTKSATGGACDEAADCSITGSTCESSTCLLPAGASCSANVQCSSPLACISSKCSPKSPTGRLCDEVADCEVAGSVCQSSKCLLPADATCTTNGQCSSPFTCIANKCTTKSPTGGACDESVDCDITGSLCQSLTCLLPSGATCAANSQCSSPLVCVNSKCATKSPAGGACDEVVDCSVAGSTCEGSKCLLPSGSTCSINTQCSTPLTCIANKCATKAVTGGACDEDVDCGTTGDFCSSAKKCTNPSLMLWDGNKAITTARSFGAGVAVGGRLLVFGGYNQNGEFTNAVEAFDPTSNSWSSLANAPVASISHSVVAVGNFVFLIGGKTSAGVLTSVYRYDAANNAWDTPWPALPEGRYNAAAAAVGNVVFLFGGATTGNTLRNTILSLDTSSKSNAWQSRTALLPVAVQSLSATTVGTNIYLTGGQTSPTTSTNSALKYNTQTPNSNPTKIAELFQARSGHTSFFNPADQRLYVVGGIFDVYQNTVESFDTTQAEPGTWTTVNAPNYVPISFPSAGVIGSRLYLTGSSSSIGALQVLDFSISTSLKWSPFPNSPSPGASIFQVTGTSKITSIDTKSGATSFYNIATNSWNAGSSPFPAPNLLNAASAVVSGQVFVMGGESGSTAVNGVRSLSATGVSWVAKAPIPEPRTGACAAASGSQIFLYGGAASSSSIPDNSLFVLDTLANSGSGSWRKVAAGAVVPTGVSNCAAVVVGSKLLIFGGAAGSAGKSPSGLIQSFDISQDKWDSPLSATIVARSRLSAVLLKGFVFVIGGTPDNFRGIPKTEIFTVSSQTVTTYKDLPSPRFGLGSVTDGISIFSLGGLSFDGNAFPSLERLRTD